MPRTDFNQLLEAGVHFGHLKRKWNPKMAPYIFMEKNGIHIIDLHKTVVKVDEAAAALKQIAKSGRRILFVATKKQAKEVVAEKVSAVNMPYVTERWPGGMLTNFPTIRKAVKKMATIDKLTADGTYDNFSKREKLQSSRQRAKREKTLGSIADLTRLPTDIEYVIPANDDATKSIAVIIDAMTQAIAEGLTERKLEKDKEAEAAAAESKEREAKPRIRKSVKVAGSDEFEAEQLAAEEKPVQEKPEAAVEEEIKEEVAQ